MVKIYSIIFLIILFIVPLRVHTAGLSIDPSYGNYEVGDRVNVKVKISSDSSVNAVSGEISFPTSNFVIESVSKAGSILDFWVSEPTFSRISGSVRFEGVSLNGFSGSSGTILNVGIKVVKSGQAKVLFKSGQILANDGQGTDVTNKLIGADFTLNDSTKEVEIQNNKPQDIENNKKTIIQVNDDKKVDNTEDKNTQAAPALKAPSIYSGNKYGNPAILGISDYPQSKILVTFLYEDGSKVFITGNTDGSGEFVSTIPRSLKRGDYKVNVVIIKDDKSNSLPSNEITINIGNIFSDMTIGIKVSFVFLLLSILYLIFRTYMHFRVDKNIHYFIRKESHQAQDVVDKTFSVIKKEINDYSKNKTTSDKKDILEIKKDLEQAEELIKKEINDIESI